MSELIDTTTPNSARVWNYWLGGKDHYPANACIGQYCASFYPGMTVLARSCRYFTARVIGYLASTGIHQFLDLGCGLPAPTGDTHQIAEAIVSDAHVVYADCDPLVLAHARALPRLLRRGLPRPGGVVQSWAVGWPCWSVMVTHQVAVGFPAASVAMVRARSASMGPGRCRGPTRCGGPARSPRASQQVPEPAANLGTWASISVLVRSRSPCRGSARNHTMTCRRSA